LTGAPGTATATGAPAAKPSAMQAAFPLFMMIGLLVLMIGFSFMASKKEKKRRETLMSSLKKGDRIVTSSGIVGEIHELLENEVVLRLEEGRMRLSKGSIATILP
jgi:preprotein translocase subunit YajC